MIDTSTWPKTVYQVAIDVVVDEHTTITGVRVGPPRQTLLEAKADLERRRMYLPSAYVRATTDLR